MIINVNFRLIWAYSSEFLLATLAYILFRNHFGAQNIATFISRTAGEWNDLTGLLFTAALTIWLTYINIQGSKFGDYLHALKADEVFSWAFISTMLCYFVTTVLLIVCGGIDEGVISNLVFFLLLYSGINTVTMVRNAKDLVSLYGTFKRVMENCPAHSEVQSETDSSALDHSSQPPEI